MKNENIIIVGGGLPGLFCALFLSKNNPTANITIIERSGKLGGLFGSIKHQKAGIFDHGMHVIYETCNDNIDRHIRECIPEKDWIFLEGNEKDIAGVFYNKNLNTKSPYIDLNEIPKPYLKKCIYDLFLSLKNNAPSTDQCNTAYDYFEKRFGSSITNFIIEPIIQKLWNKSSRQLSSMATKLVLMDRINYFSLHTMKVLMKSKLIRQRIGFPEQLLLPSKFKSSQRGLYPKKFGVSSLIDQIKLQLIKRRVTILCESEITNIKFINKDINSITVENTKGEKLINNIKLLHWTIPIFPLSKILNLPLRKDIVFDPPIKQKSIYFLLENYPRMGRLYYFYCYDKGFKTFRVTNYSAFCRSAQRSNNSYFKNAYPICVETHFSQNQKDVEKNIENIAKKELLDFGVIEKPEDILFSFSGHETGGFPILSTNNISIINKLRDDIKQIGLNNLIVAGQEPENGIFFLNEVLENVYKSIKNF